MDETPITERPSGEPEAAAPAVVDPVPGEPDPAAPPQPEEPRRKGPPRPPPRNDVSRFIAALGYPVWPVAVAALLLDPYREEPFVRFHVIQAVALGLGIWSFVAVLGGSIVLALLSAVIAVIGLLYMIVMAVRAWNGQYHKVPIVYGLVRTWIGE